MAELIVKTTVRVEYPSANAGGADMSIRCDSNEVLHVTIQAMQFSIRAADFKRVANAAYELSY